MRALTGFEPEVDFTDGVSDLYLAMRDGGIDTDAMLAQVEDRNWEHAGARA